MRIKPCPHCKGTAYINAFYSYKAHSYYVFVKCNICGAQGKVYNSPIEPSAEGWDTEACYSAVGAWNMRNGVEDEEN